MVLKWSGYNYSLSPDHLKIDPNGRVNKGVCRPQSLLFPPFKACSQFLTMSIFTLKPLKPTKLKVKESYFFHTLFQAEPKGAHNNRL